MNHIIKFKSALAISTILFVTGCNNQTGIDLAANTFGGNQVNQKQEAKTIQIVTISPATIAIDNSQNQKTSQLIGGALGGIGGGILGKNVSDKYSNEAAAIGAVGGAVIGGAVGSAASGSNNKVEGVLLSYIEDGKTFTSTQTGRRCEFKEGTALMVTTQENETRIQPNATCPVVAEPKE